MYRVRAERSIRSWQKAVWRCSGLRYPGAILHVLPCPPEGTVRLEYPTARTLTGRHAISSAFWWAGLSSTTRPVLCSTHAHSHARPTSILRYNSGPVPVPHSPSPVPRSPSLSLQLRRPRPSQRHYRRRAFHQALLCTAFAQLPSSYRPATAHLGLAILPLRLPPIIRPPSISLRRRPSPIPSVSRLPRPGPRAPP